MKTVGVLEAKSQFSKLLREAEQGEDILISRHGKVVAKLAGADQASDAAARWRKYLDNMRKLQGSLVLGPGETLKDLINAGRR